MAMVPHEQLLVKRLEGKPFALIGVDADEMQDTLKKTQEDKKMTWRSFFDGTNGPIAKAWRIEALPAIYVVDGKGVIRYKDVRGEDMDQAVDRLLKQTEEKK
jgi:AhpC/TSA family